MSFQMENVPCALVALHPGVSLQPPSAKPAGSHMLILSSTIFRYTTYLNKMVYGRFLQKAHAWWHSEALYPQFNSDSKK